jgi:hypothetical protein
VLIIGLLLREKKKAPDAKPSQPHDPQDEEP